MLRLLLASALVAMPMAQSVAGTITAVHSKDGKTRLNLDGEITKGDNDEIKAQIRKANDVGRTVVTVRLNSIGGNLVEGVEIADTVRQAKMATAVLSGARCASACFIIFAAGNEKYAHYSASIGVHGASDAEGKETVTSGAATVSMARIVRSLGVPTNIIGKMVVTPPSQMVWLTSYDLKSMGTSMLGKPDQLAQPKNPTQLPQDISPKAKASAPPTWDKLVDRAIRLSKSQNNGRVESVRTCQPEFKVCINAVWFKLKDKRMFLKVTRDLSEKIIRREVCEINSYGDIRTCANWDSDEVRKAMKNSNGDWINVD